MDKLLSIAVILVLLPCSASEEIDCTSAESIVTTGVCEAVYQEIVTDDDDAPPTSEELWELCTDWHTGDKNRDVFERCRDHVIQCGGDTRFQKYQVFESTLTFLDSYQYAICEGIEDVRDCTKLRTCEEHLYGWLQLTEDSTEVEIYMAYLFMAQPFVDPGSDNDHYCNIFNTENQTPGFFNCATMWMHCKTNPNNFYSSATYEEVRNNYCSEDCGSNVESIDMAVLECAAPDDGPTVWSTGNAINDFTGDIEPDHDLCRYLEGIRNCSTTALGECYSMAVIVANSNDQEGGDLAMAARKCNIGMMGLTNEYGSVSDEPTIMEQTTTGPTGTEPSTGGAVGVRIPSIGAVLAVCLITFVQCF